jgi:alkanesulfonate monooxygenase SsuD/methylene tetrahydromethanopterin reductase-like flavin-dependent oxidoreductase (luciferase family)
MADTLDEVSGGRLILGLGAGWHDPEFEAFGLANDRLVSRFEEALSIIARCCGPARSISPASSPPRWRA